MGDSSDKVVEGGEGDAVIGSNGNGACGEEPSSQQRRVAWVKLGKIWWPGKIVREDELTDEMKKDVNQVRSKKTKVEKNVHVVKYFNEDDFVVARNPHEIIVSPDEEKKMELVKKAILQMKAPSLASHLPKFKEDVLESERFANPSVDLTTISRLLDGESLEPKKPVGTSKYADIFPAQKPDKPPVNASPLGGKVVNKLTLLSSRIISTASSKPLSKVSPLPSDPTKKYKCDLCQYSADRVNVITNHRKHCSGKPASPVVAAVKRSPPAAADAALTPPRTQTRAAMPSPVPSPVGRLNPDSVNLMTSTTLSSSSSPVRRAPGRPPRTSKTNATTTPTASSPLLTKTISTSSPVKKAAIGGGAPKKRGRRSTKKDKIQSDKKKAEILLDWNDSSSEGEDDSDDELDMPPSKPPELFLFGSEKNKKRKADSGSSAAALLLDDGSNKTVQEDGSGVVAAPSGETGKQQPADEDQPPVLKKPRTDKELSDAFEALLKTTKPEYEKLLEKDIPGKEDEEEMEVDDHHMSDIEEDAHIVMKKVDIDEEKDVPKSDHVQEEAEKMEQGEVEKEMQKKTVEAAAPTPVEEEKKKEEPRRESRRTRNSRAAAAQLAEEGKEEKQKDAPADASLANKMEGEIQSTPVTTMPPPQTFGKQEEEEEEIEGEVNKLEKKAEINEQGNKKEEEHETKQVSQEQVVPLHIGRGRRGRKPSKVEEPPAKVAAEKEELKVVAPVEDSPALPTVSTPLGRSRRSRGAKAELQKEAVVKTTITTEPVAPPQLAKPDETKPAAVQVIKAAAATVTASSPAPTLASTRSRRGGNKAPTVEAVKEATQPKKIEPKVTSQKKVVPVAKTIEAAAPAAAVQEEKQKEEPQSITITTPDVAPVKPVVESTLVDQEKKAERAGSVSPPPPPSTTSKAEPPPSPTVKTPVASPVGVETKKLEAVVFQTETTPKTVEVAPVVVPHPVSSPQAKSKKVAPSSVSPVAVASKKQSCLPLTVNSATPGTAVVAPTSPVKVTSVVATEPIAKVVVPPPPPPVTTTPHVQTQTAKVAPPVVKPPSVEKSLVQQKQGPPAKPLPPLTSLPKPVHSPSKRKQQLPPPSPVAPPPPPPVVQEKKVTALPPPPPPIVVNEQKKERAPPPPPVVTSTAVVAPSPPAKAPAAPQKKPTAAVRPLVDTKEPPKEISSAPSAVKEMKGGNAPSNRASAPAAGAATTKSAANSGSPTQTKDTCTPTASVGQPQQPVQSQQQQQQGIADDGGEGAQDGKKSPALVAQRVVHLVPVENADGSITYMLLSLENGADNPAVLLEQGADQAGSVLRLDKVEPMDSGSGSGPAINLPMNPSEVEGIFLDKSVDNANQIVSALAAAAATTGTVTASSSLMDATTTAYVTLAMDAASAMGGLTASAPGIADASTVSAATISHSQAQSTIIINPADGSSSTQTGASAASAATQEQQEGMVVDGGQQVFYMTEDGALLDPQSLGLTLEQLQQLLNQ